ncbi:RNA-binding cell elongation regulator Jag/EloR [Desulfatitalea tepidiphila]|uniref:RNA-binding cell elongation regulator Jag/EloR n=1 Tax=Desulfatitalea tepidiphila TaxID=1185843 RepID=UPI0006B44866|nr:RNA-binding cell elongation regulator Jag/EloR [Desulfatitalea tepidiphila]
MTDFIEYEGKSVDKALEKASKELDLPLDQLSYDVISYGSTGIFGLVGVKKAKIRVKTSHFKGSLHREAKQKAKDLVKSAFGIEEKTEEAQVVSSVDLDCGKQALQRIVDAISEGATITAEHKNHRIIFKIEGGNSGLLIGKRGQTLEAIQYLIEKIVNKNNDNRLRVLVDVEGYLDTRQSNLKRMATKMAEKAQKINKPVTIGQMNAYDRRIVHLHLKDNQAVRTQSVGDGNYRKLIIFPKRKRHQRSN